MSSTNEGFLATTIANQTSALGYMVHDAADGSAIDVDHGTGGARLG